MSNKHIYGSTASWVILLGALIVALNYLVFIIYHGANPGENIWVQIWAYLQTVPFQVITVSLFLPIILILLESKFKIVETIRKAQIERENRLKDERGERRLACINETSQMWNQLWTLTNEVCCFRKRPNREAAINNLILQLENFPSSTEDLVNRWDYRFRNLKYQDTSSFLEFINTLFLSTATVAECIRDSNDVKEISELQNTLGMIRNAIGSMAHHNILSTLRYSMEKLELEEAGALSDEQLKNKKTVEQKIDNSLFDLKCKAGLLKLDRKANNPVFSFIKGRSVEDFRKSYNTMRDWVMGDVGINPSLCDEYDNLKELYFGIPYKKRIDKGPYFSKEYVKHLASWLGFEIVMGDLQGWIRFDEEGKEFLGGGVSLRMEGSYDYTSSEIDRVVTKILPGNYALGRIDERGAFIVVYVGRSDIDVNSELKAKLNDKYKKFKYSYAISPKGAFGKECRKYHDFGGSEQLDNEIHPRCPDGTDLKCPVCGA